MIVDEADRDVEMAKDPFLEAGIDIPSELPYQTPTIKRKFSVMGKKDRKINDPDLESVSCQLPVASLAKTLSNSLVNDHQMDTDKKDESSKSNEYEKRVSNKIKNTGTTNPSIDMPDENENADKEEITNAGIEMWNLNEGFEETETQSKIV